MLRSKVIVNLKEAVPKGARRAPERLYPVQEKGSKNPAISVEEFINAVYDRELCRMSR